MDIEYFAFGREAARSRKKKIEAPAGDQTPAPMGLESLESTRRPVSMGRGVGPSELGFGQGRRKASLGGPDIALAPAPATSEIVRPLNQTEAVKQDKEGALVAAALPLYSLAGTKSDLPTDHMDPPDCTWGIEAIGAKTSGYTGTGVTVAVIDSGISATAKSHPAFKGVRIVTKDFSGVGDAIDTSDGHGTHCAATIVGRKVNGRRIGVAPGVKKLLVARLFAPGTTPTTAKLLDALDWAVRNGADVVSMSLSIDLTTWVDQLIDDGMPTQGAMSMALMEFERNIRVFDKFMEYMRSREGLARAKNAVIVAAVGNHSKRKASDGQKSYIVPAAVPSNADGIVSVGAITPGATHEVADFSNGKAMLLAPGVNIYSADLDDGTDVPMSLRDGTSMACPHVAGLAALWWEYVRKEEDPDFQTASFVVQKMQEAARRPPKIATQDKCYGLARAPQKPA